MIFHENIQRRLFGSTHTAGREIVFYLFFVPVLKLKRRSAGGYRVYFLGIPLWKVGEAFFEKLTIARISKGNDRYRQYVQWLMESNANPSENFVAITPNPHVSDINDVKLLAFYLPQFHRIDINDQYYGRGFTDWNNVTRAVPHFIGHYQPHLPIDVGFYDLTHATVMHRQIELAKLYGIHGFCFHYYWFSGRRLLDTPLLNFLHDKSLNLPFCLCWANENWSTLWDGGTREVFLHNEHVDADCERFFEDILPFFKDERYIRIDNKPLMIIYRPQLLTADQREAWFEKWKNLARSHGFDGIYLVTIFRDKDQNPSDFGMDALLEFPPQNLRYKNGSSYADSKQVELCNHKSSIKVVDMERYIKDRLHERNPEFTLFKGVFPSWDNTARKGYSSGMVYAGVTPELYRIWLSDCIGWTKRHNRSTEQFVFINAWNEWAESAHLEPDIKYGYAYLQATKDALEQKSRDGGGADMA